jgi:hypothetical protein
MLDPGDLWLSRVMGSVSMRLQGSLEAQARDFEADGVTHQHMDLSD